MRNRPLLALRKKVMCMYWETLNQCKYMSKQNIAQKQYIKNNIDGMELVIYNI